MSNFSLSDLLLASGQSKSLAQSRLSIGRRVIKPVSRGAYTNLRTFNATRQTIRMIIPYRQVVPPLFCISLGKHSVGVYIFVSVCGPCVTRFYATLKNYEK